MKKFSKITGEKVSEKPIEKQKNEADTIKYSIMGLMDNYLGVKFYGPVTRYQVAGTAKVSGKEMFLGALLDLLEEYSSKEKVKILESLKSDISDWELIDNKVSELKNHINKISESKLVNHREKIRSLYNRYKSDEKMLMEQVDKSISKIKNGETAYLKSIAAETLISESILMKQISQKYLSKSKELGYE